MSGPEQPYICNGENRQNRENQQELAPELCQREHKTHTYPHEKQESAPGEFSMPLELRANKEPETREPERARTHQERQSDYGHNKPSTHRLRQMNADMFVGLRT